MFKIQLKGMEKVQLSIKNKIEKKLPQTMGKVYLSEIKKNIKTFSKSGQLYKSMKLKTFRGGFKIYSTLPYSNIQNVGGKIKLTKKMRGKMWALYYQTKDIMYKNIAITKSEYVKIPPKSYTTVNIKKVIRIVKTKIKF